MFVKGKFHPDFVHSDFPEVGKLKPAYSTARGAMFQSDAIDILRKLPADSVDLVMTSPPFALTRQKEYGNEPIERYVNWFMPFCHEIKRVLKKEGSFVLDIGGSWIPGSPVRSVYHFDLAVRLSKFFFLAQEFYWYNPARLPTPAEWVTVRRLRVKDAVNMVWWFGKTEWPKANNKKVLQPYSASMQDLLKNGYKAQKRPSGHDISTKFQRDNGGSIPSNLITIANTDSGGAYLRKCRQREIKPHPARYPDQLVKFFLDFLTDENALVVDPFGGSNVTGAVCELHSRRWLASEVEMKYIEGSMIRFEQQPTLFDPPVTKRKTKAATKG
ncbi:MAG TPA: site-specific DNA-methyltransferase [Planctomycetaceae bacterium]|jgi:site-specific DNA-methyltransferase (cytosine-N4-specific)